MIEKIINTVNGWVWSPALVALCLLAGLYFSFGTRFVQVRRFGEMARLLFSTDKSQKTGITSFQAFSMALSGRVGTGNIVGVATAIGYGGPGAIVWMWIIAFLGAGSAFAEATLAQIFKENHKGEYRGGPAYYIEKGLKAKWLGVVFAVCAVVACGVFLPPVQSNGIAISFANTLDVNPAWIGMGVALLIGFVIIGGVKRIANVAQIVAPFMAIIYILLSIVILIVHAGEVPVVFGDMIRSAFGMNEVFGGILGSTIAWGVKRGIYSNEAGQGTAPIVAAAAKTRNAVRQALVSSTGTFWDTVIICALTGIVLISCVLSGNLSYDNGASLTKHAFALIPVVGTPILVLGMVFFAFTTSLGWSYYSERAYEYLFGKKNLMGFRIFYCLTCFAGAVANLALVWSFADSANALMAIPNLISLLFLSGVVVKDTRRYLWNERLDEHDTEIHH